MTRHVSNHTCRAEFPTPLSLSWSLPLFLALPPAWRKRERERGTPRDRLEKPGGWEWEIISCLLWLRHTVQITDLHSQLTPHYQCDILKPEQTTDLTIESWLIKQQIISWLLTNGILLIVSKCMWLVKFISLQ